LNVEILTPDDISRFGQFVDEANRKAKKPQKNRREKKRINSDPNVNYNSPNAAAYKIICDSDNRRYFYNRSL
jgi:hypothetical protein